MDIIYVGSKPWFNFLLHRVWDEVGFGGGVAVLKPVTVIFKSLCSKEHEAQVTLGVGAIGGFGIGFPAAFLGGGISFGFTTNGNFIVQMQGLVSPLGAGAYLGAGAQAGLSYSNSASVPTGDGPWATSTVVQLDANVGVGSSAGFSVQKAIGSGTGASSGV